jgi:3-dehydroquinate dehydratase type I
VIVLTIPFKNAKQAVADHDIYKGKFRWQEFRLDFSENPQGLPEKILDSYTILTYRDKSEGGKGNIGFQEKIKLLTDIVRKKNCLLDIELKLYNIRNLPADNLILSFHDFSPKLDLKSIAEIITEANTIPAKYLKLAITINSYSDLTTIRKLIISSNKPVLLAGLGKLSHQARILYHHLGAVGTYIGPADALINQDQLTVQEADRYRLSKLSKRSIITGIIGGEQIYNSLGLDFYNDSYEDKGSDAVYIPFWVEDIKDFLNWVADNKANICGLSVTMPYKREICRYVPCNYPVGNLFLPEKNLVLNSDVTAFYEAIFQLQICNNKRILILGTGATAEAALIAFKDFTEITLSGRNHQSGNQLAEKYNCRFSAPFDLSSFEYELLINCTPLGMLGENPLKIYNINPPHQAIDLPYRETDTPLINYCKEKGIKYISGQTFWNWQSKLQIEEFNKCLPQ